MASVFTSIETDGEPAWEIARLFPDQGAWDEQDYLVLETNHLVEFSDGAVDVLPMPTTLHQLIVGFLYTTLATFVSKHGLGTPAHAPLRVRVRPGKFREPDVLFMQAKHSKRIGKRAWEGADLVMEVVSEDEESRIRDYETKPPEYAAAGISEYWIVDPQQRRITILRLERRIYVLHGEFVDGETAPSKLLPGFDLDVTAVFDAGKLPEPSDS